MQFTQLLVAKHTANCFDHANWWRSNCYDQ